MPDWLKRPRAKGLAYFKDTASYVFFEVDSVEMEYLHVTTEDGSTEWWKIELYSTQWIAYECPEKTSPHRITFI